MNGLQSTREDLTEKLNEKRTLLTQTRTSVGALTMHLQTEDEKKTQLMSEVNDLDRRVQDKINETTNQKNRKAKLDVQLKDRKESCEESARFVNQRKATSSKEKKI